MRICTYCHQRAKTHEIYSHLCFCRNESCPLWHKTQYGKKVREERPVRQRKEKVNTSEGTRALSQMIRDVLAHHELKREMRAAQRAAIVQNPDLFAA